MFASKFARCFTAHQARSALPAALPAAMPAAQSQLVQNSGRLFSTDDPSQSASIKKHGRGMRGERRNLMDKIKQADSIEAFFDTLMKRRPSKENGVIDLPVKNFRALLDSI